MNNTLLVIGMAFGLALWGCEAVPGVAAGGAANPDADHTIVEAEQVEWQQAPPALRQGAELAVLQGDPAEEERFVVRLRMPDGFVIDEHAHPHHERVTVLEGTLHLSVSEEHGGESWIDLPEGSYFHLPPGLPHAARAEGETVIQITGTGPFEAEYVHPAHDPRR